MEMKSRQAYILRNLINSVDAPEARQFLDEFDIAKRTLYYDIDKINDWLAQGDWGSVEIRGHKLCLNVKNKTTVLRQLNKGSNYFFSVQERRAMQIIFITLSCENTSINRLMDYFLVSKNTILADIKEIKRELTKFCLKLSSTTKTRYLVLGEEASVRKVIWAQFQVLGTPECISVVCNFLQENLVLLTQNDVDYAELCRCLVKQYEIDIGGDRLLSNIQKESMMIQVSWIRSHKGFIINMYHDEEAALMNTLSYRSLELSLQKMKRYDILLQEQEIYYITSLFLGIQTTDFTTQEQENLYILKLSEKLIYSFEKVACLYFANRERLHKQLSHHIRPLYYRLKYGITLKNPLVKDILRMYPLVYEFTRRAIECVDVQLLKSISEDELAYLCIYFASNLNEEYSQQGEFSPEDVLIIGPENMATAALVRKQFEDLLGLSWRYTVISAEQVKDWILDGYALVISLTRLNLPCEYENMVEIVPILGEDEYGKIIEVLKRNKVISQYNDMIEDIIMRVECNITGTLESDKLYLDLLRFFEERDHKKIESVASVIFMDKITDKNVFILPDGTSFEQVLMYGSRALLGDVRNSLGQRMRNLLMHKRLQMYRMHPDVVLVHCPMQGNVDSKIDVSILLSSEGVTCIDGRRANIMVFLSTVNRYTHWNLLKDIYQYFDLQTHVDVVKKMYGKE
jgi:transcriptional antiterminator